MEIADTEEEIADFDDGLRPKPRRRQSLDKSVDQQENRTQKDASKDKGNANVEPLEVTHENERDTDSECSDEERGYEYVPRTYIHGDAHGHQMM